MEEDDPSYVCSLVESAAHESQQDADRASLSPELLQKLAEVFGEQISVDGTLWEELSLRRVPIGRVVNGLVGTMEQAGRISIQAAYVYLGLLLAPECPSYSLFSPLALQVLLRCIHNSCKLSGGASTDVKVSSNSRKKTQKKGKRARQVEEDSTAEQDGSLGPAISLEEIIPVLSRLRVVLRVIYLKDYQGALRSLLEFLVEVPHMTAHIQEWVSEERSQKVRKCASANADSSEVIKFAFDVLEDVLEPNHGDTTTTAVSVLKLLTPSLYLTRSGGSPQQKSQIRTAALEFVVKVMLGKGTKTMQTAVVALTRYLCFKAPEKSDARAQAIETIMILVKALSAPEQQQFGKFVVKLSRGKARYRLLAVDLCAALFAQMPDPLGLDNSDGERGGATNAVNDSGAKRSSTSGVWWGLACLEAVLQRCSDKVPTIRGRALSTLGQVIDLLSAHVRERIYLQELFAALGSSGIGATTTEESTAWDTPFQDIAAMGGQNMFTVSGTRTNTPALLSPGAHKGDLGSLVRKRCSDDKAAVRKAALVLMTKATILMGKSPDEQTLKAMGTACSDPMLSIRKAALAAMSEVTRKYCRSKKVVTEWLQSALPLVIDNESSIQEEATGLFQELILDPIASTSVLRVSSQQLQAILLEQSDGPEKSLPPGVLHFLSGLAEESDKALYIKRVCTRLGRSKGLRPSIAMALQNIITASEELGKKKRFSEYKRVELIAQGAWFLLSELSVFLPKVVGWDFLRTHWQLLSKQGPVRCDDGYTPVPFSSCKKPQFQESAAWAASRVHLLQTIANVALELPPDAAADLADEFLKHLEEFNLHPAEVGAHVNALTTLCRQKAASGAEGEELVTEWAKQLLHKAEAVLKNYLSSDDIPFQTPLPSSKTNGRRRKGAEVTRSAQVVTAIFTVGATILVCPLSNAGGIIPLLQELVGEKSREKTKTGDFQQDPAVGAQAWVTLGKLCLADDRLAKRLIPLFVQELESTRSAAIRNNIMVTLTDFCVRYTALIESYIPQLTKSLRDSCEIVRRQTFILLARLLQRDYVKWRGMLFHRFLLALVDDSPKICLMADFLFGAILKTKAPLLAYNSFVEAIFVLNDYQGQFNGSTVLQSSESERDLFSLRGNSQAVATKRMHIYTTLLKQMNPEHLLATSAKLCAEVLAGAVDGLIDLAVSSGKCVVEDALKILASKEMRFGGSKTAPSAADQGDEEDGATAFAAMKGKVVTQLAKRNLVQNAIPIFIELKRLLEKSSSPLLGVLMDCMRTMLKDYKNEIEEMLVADKQLQKEILYDMQKHETAKARAKVEAATAKAMQSEPQRQQSRSRADAGDKIDNIDKENREPSGRPATVCKPPVVSAIRKKALETPGGARVTWQDQTPQLRGISGTFVVSPRAVMRSRNNLGTVVSPRSLVGAVGDMAAAATAASVLHEAATGKSTPLKSMSIPRLRTSAQQVPGNEERLESVRRRLDG